MTKNQPTFNPQQLLFKEFFVGTLIYAVVLGFFNDYTTIVDAKSFSTIFFASIVLELLTLGAFRLKSEMISLLKDHNGTVYKAATFFFVWLIMFLSKFVFIAVVDFIFGDNINIYGFFGILLVVASVTIIHKLANMVFLKLGTN